MLNEPGNRLNEPENRLKKTPNELVNKLKKKDYALRKRLECVYKREGFEITYN